MALQQLRDDDAFISRILAFLPQTMKQGYADSDSDSDAEDDQVPLTREEKQDELRAKLHAKLQMLREKSGSLRAQKTLRKRLNKMEKRKQKQKQSGKGGGVNSKLNAVKTAKKQKMIERRSGKPGAPIPGADLKSKPVFNADGKVVFSKFDFAHTAAPAETAGKGKKMSLKAKLAQAREKQASKQNMSAEASKREAWDVALRKASGEKIKDDPKLLAKSLRRHTQQKKRSKKKWEERKENELQKKQEKQSKRDANIMKRKDQKKKKVTDRLKKKGRILPGF